MGKYHAVTGVRPTPCFKQAHALDRAGAGAGSRLHFIPAASGVLYHHARCPVLTSTKRGLMFMGRRVLSCREVSEVWLGVRRVHYGMKYG